MRELILKAALEAAETTPYNRVTREQVADKAGVAPANVQYYFKSIDGLRRDIVRAAVELNVLPIMAAAMGLRDVTFAREASDDQKRDVLTWLVEYYRLQLWN